jgi:Ser/Thr protein kinase RdoA (MazF antagonist)
VNDLADGARAAFGLDAIAPMSLTPVGRGALGRIFRLEIGSSRYALKELFGSDRPSSAQLAAETTFAARANAAGVTVPLSHRATDGEYVVASPTGFGWLRLYDWAAGSPLTANAAGQIGTLLGRLHRCAPPMTREPDGGAPDPWYEQPPDPHVWPRLAGRARSAGFGWADALVERLPRLSEVTAMATPAQPNSMIACHRDLHPENVLADSGRLTVIDWDDFGPADPSRELVRVLLDWFTADDGRLDADAVGTAISAYRHTGAPGRVAEDAYGFAISSRLNFLHRQLGIALDPATEPQHRDWAEREIREGLALLPSRDLFNELRRAGGS